MREGLSPLSRLICEIVISVGQEKFGECQKSLAVATMLLSQSWASAASSSPERHNLDHHVCCRPHSKLCSCPCSPRP